MLTCNDCWSAEGTTADLQGNPKDTANLAVSEAGGVISLPHTDAAGGLGERVAHGSGNGALPHELKSSSEAAEEGNRELGAWELLRFTLPTLGVWIINPVLR